MYIITSTLCDSQQILFFKLNYEIHGIGTRTVSYTHTLLSQLTTYQKGMYYFGSKVLNSLPTQIKDLSYCVKLFKLTLKKLFVLSFTLYFRGIF
jgi:hypothetical protein